MSDYSAYLVVTNRHLCRGDYLAQVEKLVALGPRGLILREKDLPPSDYALLAEKVLKICASHNVPCFLHSHVEIARGLGCGRIHLSIPTLRENAGQLDGFREISVSCHSLEDLVEAVQGGASQVLLGNIFETDCKKGLPGKGLAFLRAFCARSPVPVYAIGGVTPERLPSLLEAGAAGGCMMSGFMGL